MIAGRAEEVDGRQVHINVKGVIGPSNLISAHPALTSRLAGALPSLRRLVIWGLERDAYVPTLSASLEWIKYIGTRTLPTMFMEAELDLFGPHKFDKRDFDAAKSGVKSVHIVDGRIEHSVLLEILTEQPFGTMIRSH